MWASQRLCVYLSSIALLASATQVFVMLPLDAVTNDGNLHDRDGLAASLDKLKGAGVDGIMSDVWWGLTEQSQKVYNFKTYQTIVDMARQRNLKVQFVASFHQCGGNVGDTCNIPLPAFLNGHNIWYKDAFGNEDHEYVSLFADNVTIGGRSILQMYSDWFSAFATAFSGDLGSTIQQIQVGMGPAGELRYPAYQLSHWSFCGVGAFQCFDDNAIASFLSAAVEAGHKEWNSPPTDVGDYNTQPGDSSFFRDGYKSDYGRFFMDWYFSALKTHGANVLSRAKAAFGGKVGLAGKIAGIHWWYNSPHHAAELTAGYYNTNERDAYAELAEVFAANGNAAVDFTCLEMRDREQSSACASGPEELVQQVQRAAKGHGLELNGENALPRYDDTAYQEIESYRNNLHSFTYLRLGSDLLKDDNFNHFKTFVSSMHNGASVVV